MATNRSTVRHTDGDREFCVDIRHLPLVVTSWFGAPSIAIVDAYDAWLQRFIETSSMSGRRVVLLDDATRAERPSPAVRGRLAKIECPPNVVVARVIVAPTSALRGAVTALTWSTGKPLQTVDTIEAGINECLRIFAEQQIVPPRKFDIVPAQRSS